jgi:hypothetical protein
MMEKQGTLQRIYSVTEYEPLSVGRYRPFFASMQASESRLPDYFPFTGHLYADASRPEFRLLDLMSVRYAAVRLLDRTMMQGIARRSAEWRTVDVPGLVDYALFERTDPLPRAYVAFDTRPVHDEAAALTTIQNADFDPRRSVVIETDAGDDDAHERAVPIAAARVATYEPSRVVVHTDTTAAGELVLTDTFFPGWYAWVDDEPQPIRRANYLFRAVRLPAGHHVVTFRYAPRSVRLGAAITLVTLVIGAIVLVRRRGTRRG